MNVQNAVYTEDTMEANEQIKSGGSIYISCQKPAPQIKNQPTPQYQPLQIDSPNKSQKKQITPQLQQ